MVTVQKEVAHAEQILAYRASIVMAKDADRRKSFAKAHSPYLNSSKGFAGDAVGSLLASLFGNTSIWKLQNTFFQAYLLCASLRVCHKR